MESLLDQPEPPSFLRNRSTSTPQTLEVNFLSQFYENVFPRKFRKKSVKEIKILITVLMHKYILCVDSNVIHVLTSGCQDLQACDNKKDPLPAKSMGTRRYVPAPQTNWDIFIGFRSGEY